jgi:hypothetical protein
MTFQNNQLEFLYLKASILLFLFVLLASGYQIKTRDGQGMWHIWKTGECIQGFGGET